MSDLDLSAIEARANAATPGPWEIHEDYHHDASTGRRNATAIASANPGDTRRNRPVSIL